jgi:hypothetical protein
MRDLRGHVAVFRQLEETEARRNQARRGHRAATVQKEYQSQDSFSYPDSKQFES